MVAEASQFPNHSFRALSLGRLADRGATFLVADALVENLPDQATKPMGHDSDRDVVAQARHVTPVEESEDTAFELDRRVGRLIENAPHMTVTFRRVGAGIDSRAFVIAGAGTYPGGEFPGGREGGGCDAHFRDDLLRRIDPQPGNLAQPLHLVLMRAEQSGHLFLQLPNLHVHALPFF